MSLHSIAPGQFFVRLSTETGKPNATSTAKFRFEEMTFVYILRSIAKPEETYVGATLELRRRLEYHNSRRCAHTSKFVPWEIVYAEGVKDKTSAFKRERQI
ncbi:MAG: GIY-YIG nuclease family protein [Deltaproteobacteria bacterium]|nr:GIY-YIG nuclease family protein [Deltaproteobacteria bacterium]